MVAVPSGPDVRDLRLTFVVLGEAFCVEAAALGVLRAS